MTTAPDSNRHGPLNTRTLPEIQNALEAILAELRGYDFGTAPAETLVPLAACDYAQLVHAKIEERAIGNGELIPGVAVKDTTVHRRWTDAEAAAQLAQEAFGDKAFSRTLLSPAQMEKLDGGAVFVAMAAVKPPAGKKVVY